jgi:hypothetical protein
MLRLLLYVSPCHCLLAAMLLLLLLLLVWKAV